MGRQMRLSSPTRRGFAPPATHVARHDPSDASGPTYGEQTVEIALGPNGAFQDGNVAALTRRVPPERALIATTVQRAKSTSPRQPRTPRVAVLLRKALEWQARLESGDIANQAAIASQEGITRARVTQVMALLKLAPEIQQHIRSMPRMRGRPTITERALRSIAQADEQEQKTAFESLLTHR